MTEKPSDNHTPDINISQGAAAEKKYWIDDKNNIRKSFRVLVIACVLLFLSDALYHKHVILDFENWFGFYGLFGFIALFTLVLVARQLRKLIMRSEDYYDR